ncbi:NADH-quinone oxidoreductase subunit M [Campylobacter geochelonis]|uniref:NADH dehydrogenase subunit M n=1 Tax=Campylobacter geochelonis TaxID=1780362 RepID=A0A128EAM9_9BACT|nr:NADH-quinone oxidoreductase subunit M [Campylobacter geochelonis]QKF70551.1 NADH:quinone oxidoreductase I, membrane subunit M [Campylobacter geochelonis]CZE46056.1 NADH dehydrogenase subunit M [Campylobacter geochelonis]CZE50407.1 NADH dehydrogenase subunit M [Campylobacter geochelonis]
MDHLLSLVIFFPALAACFAFIIDEKSIKTYAISISFIEFCLTLFVWAEFASLKAGEKFSELVSFIPEFGINYFLGVDGISLFLVVLSAFMTFVGLISLTITDRLKHLIISILFLEMTMMGVFLSLDAVIFYIFWELSLLPMLYIIGSWGSGKRVYAAVKFFLYTFFGSVLMLVGIVSMAYFYYVNTGSYSFNILEWRNLSLPLNTQIWLFLAFSIAFAIKTPLFPFHTWLPYAHGQAPTIGSILLAAVLLKMGTYGFVRFSLPLFPDASVYFADFMCVIAIIMIVYTSFIAFAQKDIKQVIAYSSIAHMGVIMLGIFSMSVEGVSGAVFLMLSHGIVSGGLFMLVGFIYDRRHTKLLGDFGGLAKVMPTYATLFAIVLFGSIGLPLTIGFVGEFLSLIGIFKASPIYAFLGGLGIIMGAIYSLNLYKKTFFGAVTNEENRNLKDLNKTELFAIVPIAILTIVLGVYPNLLLKDINASVKQEISSMYEKSKHMDSKTYLEKSNIIRSLDVK